MTFTGWYLQLGYTVIYERVGQNDVTVLFPDGNVLRGKGDKGQDLLDYYGNLLDENKQSHTVYLFDPCGETPREPLGVKAFTIVAPSPNPAHYKQFMKVFGQIRLLPLWSLEEVLELRKSMPNAPSEEEVQQRFGVFGGIPRSIFAKNQNKVNTTLITAIENFNLSSIEAFFKTGQLPETDVAHADGSHKIIHAELNEIFESTRLAFNSKYIEKQVLDLELDKRNKEYLRFFSNALEHGPTKILAGTMYDYFVKHKIAKRAKKSWEQEEVFKQDPILKHVKPGGYEMPVEDKVFFMKMKPGTFVVPSQAGFPAADALLRLDIEGQAYLVVFSATVGKEHNLKLESLMERIPDFPWVAKGTVKKASSRGNSKMLLEQQKNFRLVWLLPNEQHKTEFKALGASQNEVVAMWDITEELTGKDVAEVALKKE